MFQTRTDPLYLKIKQIIDDGELGEIIRMTWIATNWFRTWTYFALGGWRGTWAGEGGGVLINQNPHNLDLLQWLPGMMPERITAIAAWGNIIRSRWRTSCQPSWSIPTARSVILSREPGSIPARIGLRSRGIVDGWCANGGDEVLPDPQRREGGAREEPGKPCAHRDLGDRRPHRDRRARIAQER